MAWKDGRIIQPHLCYAATGIGVYMTRSALIADRHSDCDRLRGDEVSLFGAFGPCTKGWHQLEKTFDWVASRYREGVVTDEYEIVHESADLAYTVGYEIRDVVLDGAPMARQRLRVTQIYRREDGEWHLVHRHGDFARLTRARHDRNGTEHDTLRVRWIAKRECSPVALGLLRAVVITAGSVQDRDAARPLLQNWHGAARIIAGVSAQYFSGWDEFDGNGNDREPAELWMARRPLTPYGLPILDRVHPFENLYLATGHSMLGITLAPASGRARHRSAWLRGAGLRAWPGS